MTNHYRPKKEFHVTRKHPARGVTQYLFQVDDRLCWGPKRLATKFRGRLLAERIAHIAMSNKSKPRCKVVRA